MTSESSGTDFGDSAFKFCANIFFNFLVIFICAFEDQTIESILKTVTFEIFSFLTVPSASWQSFQPSAFRTRKTNAHHTARTYGHLHFSKHTRGGVTTSLKRDECHVECVKVTSDVSSNSNWSRYFLFLRVRTRHWKFCRSPAVALLCCACSWRS
jgi:hypothetical protein